MFAGMLRPGEHRNTPCPREPLLEQFNALAHELYGQIAHPGEIATRPGPALHKIDIEGITTEAEHHWCCGLHRPEREDCELLRYYHLRIGCEEFARNSFHVVQSRCPEQVDRQIAAFSPTQFAQTRTQGIQIG